MGREKDEEGYDDDGGGRVGREADEPEDNVDDGDNNDEGIDEPTRGSMGRRIYLHVFHPHVFCGCALYGEGGVGGGMGGGMREMGQSSSRCRDIRTVAAAKKKKKKTTRQCEACA